MLLLEGLIFDLGGIMKACRLRIWSVFCLAVVAFSLIFNEVEAANPKLVSTWKGGIHFLPASATRMLK